MGEKEQAAELGEAISGRACRKALRCLIAALLAEMEQVVGAAVVFLPPTVTQDYTLQNKMKLFPLFLISCSLEALMRVFKEPRLVAVFIGKMKNMVSLTSVVEIKALGDRGSLCF